MRRMQPLRVQMHCNGAEWCRMNSACGEGVSIKATGTGPQWSSVSDWGSEFQTLSTPGARGPCGTDTIAGFKVVQKYKNDAGKVAAGAVLRAMRGTAPSTTGQLALRPDGQLTRVHPAGLAQGGRRRATGAKEAAETGTQGSRFKMGPQRGPVPSRPGRLGRSGRPGRPLSASRERRKRRANNADSTRASAASNDSRAKLGHSKQTQAHSHTPHAPRRDAGALCAVDSPPPPSPPADSHSPNARFRVSTTPSPRTEMPTSVQPSALRLRRRPRRILPPPSVFQPPARAPPALPLRH